MVEVSHQSLIVNAFHKFNSIRDKPLNVTVSIKTVFSEISTNRNKQKKQTNKNNIELKNIAATAIAIDK